VKPAQLKPKKCKQCKIEFMPVRAMQAVCGAYCAGRLVKNNNDRTAAKKKAQDKRETKAKLEGMKGRGYWIAQAQAAFNSWVRARDRAAGNPCISSGKPLDWSGNAVDAGHFRSRGSAPHLRFDERNCHSQTKYENRHMSGNVTGYRIGLIDRIGLEAVEALEADQEPRKYTIDDLKEIKATYTAKARELKKEL